MKTTAYSIQSLLFYNNRMNVEQQANDNKFTAYYKWRDIYRKDSVFDIWPSQFWPQSHAGHDGHCLLGVKS